MINSYLLLEIETYSKFLKNDNGNSQEHVTVSIQITLQIKLIRHITFILFAILNDRNLYI